MHIVIARAFSARGNLITQRDCFLRRNDEREGMTAKKVRTENLTITVQDAETSSA